MYNLAVPAAGSIVTVSTKWLCLSTESTTTMTASFPSDSGSSTIKSTLVSHGVSGIGSRCSSPTGDCRLALVHRHMSQVETYLPMYLDVRLQTIKLNSRQSIVQRGFKQRRAKRNKAVDFL